MKKKSCRKKSYCEREMVLKEEKKQLIKIRVWVKWREGSVRRDGGVVLVKELHETSWAGCYFGGSTSLTRTLNIIGSESTLNKLRDILLLSSSLSLSCLIFYLISFYCTFSHIFLFICLCLWCLIPFSIINQGSEDVIITYQVHNHAFVMHTFLPSCSSFIPFISIFHSLSVEAVWQMGCWKSRI